MTRPNRWVPTAYLAEGLPFAFVAWTSATLLKDLGYSDGMITGPLGVICTAWSLKPLYASALDQYRTKKFWVVSSQLLMAATLGLGALMLALPEPYWPLLTMLGLLALAGSAHDICVDGIYLTLLDPQNQARWMGWQGAFWTAGKIFSASALVALASYLQGHGYAPHRAWQASFALAAVALAVLACYHWWQLPTENPRSRNRECNDGFVRALVVPWRDFFGKERIAGMLMFVLFFRFAEGFVLMETPLFMQASTGAGGLGMCATTALSTECPHWLSDRAFIDGFLSTTLSVVFGILGGKFAERLGLSNRLLLIMAACINVPLVTLIYLSHAAAGGVPVSLTTIAILVSIEKAGYSFGFVANMLYMMQRIAPGNYPMTHLALCTALMNAAIIPTQAVSGGLAEQLGYSTFFLVVCLAAIPSFLVAAKAPMATRGS